MACVHGYAVVDVETTGLSPRADRVVQIAVTLLDDAGAVERSWSTLVNPQRDPGPVHVHGLTPALLDVAPTYPDVARTVSDLMAQRVLVAHNADFDWAFLRAEQERAGLPLPTKRRLCTVDLAKKLQLEVPNRRLSTLAHHFGVEQVRAHDAVDDTRVLVEVFQHSLELAARDGYRLPTIPCTGPLALYHAALRSEARYRARRRWWAVKKRGRRARRALRRWRSQSRAGSSSETAP